MLTRKSKYGIKAMLLLAEEADSGPVLISELAERQRLPKKFLEAILVDLRDSGLLDSQRGRHGGYRLARPAASITFAEVIRAIDGPLAPIRCRTVARPIVA